MYVYVYVGMNVPCNGWKSVVLGAGVMDDNADIFDTISLAYQYGQ